MSLVFILKKGYCRIQIKPKYSHNYLLSKSPRHLIIDDNQKVDFDITNTNTFTDVSYTRAISEGEYSTIMLPFAPDAASLENYAFYELAERGDGYMKFEEVVAPTANTPYIYTLREGKENVAITGGETTISSNEIDGFGNGAIFDLSDRKVSEPGKGNIYIKNGKKILF